MEEWEEKVITVAMDIEDDIGNYFRADVTMTLVELREILSRYDLDVCRKE